MFDSATDKQAANFIGIDLMQVLLVLRHWCGFDGKVRHWCAPERIAVSEVPQCDGDEVGSGEGPSWEWEFGARSQCMF